MLLTAGTHIAKMISHLGAILRRRVAATNEERGGAERSLANSPSANLSPLDSLRALCTLDDPHTSMDKIMNDHRGVKRGNNAEESSGYPDTTGGAPKRLATSPVERLDKGATVNRFEIIEILGEGSYGKVARVSDIKSKQEFALKIQKSQHEPDCENEEFSESQIIRRLNSLDPFNRFHIIRLLETFSFEDHHCMVFDYLPLSVWQYLLKHRGGIDLGDTRTIAHQLLEALHFLQRSNVIHCDVKPDNIMVKGKDMLEIKLIDFSCSMTMSSSSTTDYGVVATRCYRPVEVLLGLPIDYGVDIWSLGCTLAQLHLGRYLFHGATELHQLHQYVEVLGMPPVDMIENGRRKLDFFIQDDEGKHQLITPINNGSHGPPGSRSLYDTLGKRTKYMNGSMSYVTPCTRQLIDLIGRMLIYKCDGEQARITAAQALEHEFFSYFPKPWGVKFGYGPRGDSGSSGRSNDPNEQRYLIGGCAEKARENITRNNNGAEPGVVLVC